MAEREHDDIGSDLHATRERRDLRPVCLFVERNGSLAVLVQHDFRRQRSPHPPVEPVEVGGLHAPRGERHARHGRQFARDRRVQPCSLDRVAEHVVAPVEQRRTGHDGAVAAH